MKCKHCGIENTQYAVYCRGCGNPLTTSKHPSILNRLFLIISVFSFIFLIYSLLSTIFHDGPYEEHPYGMSYSQWCCRDILHIYTDYGTGDTSYEAIADLNSTIWVAVIWTGPIFIISTLLYKLTKKLKRNRYEM